MMQEPKCWTRKCRHFVGAKNDGDETTERWICKAFLDGIPVEIAYGDNKHDKPFPGDHGIQYEKQK